MCFGGGGAAKRAAELARQEAERQAAIERQRLAEEAEKARQEAERRAKEEAERWQKQLDQQKADAEALRKQLMDQAAAQLAEQQRVEDLRKQERDADLARQLAERQKAEETATRNAATIKSYNEGRQGLVDSARGKIEAAFAPYDDSFYNKYAGDYASYYMPQMEKAYNDAQRATTFKFANQGSLKSSAAGRSFSQLGDTYEMEKGNIADRARAASNTFRTGVDQQRRDLLNSVFGTVAAAPVITADNVGEANTNLTNISTALNNPISLASSAAGSISPPTFGAYTNPFSVAQGANPRGTAVVGRSTTDPYVKNKATSGRLVT